MKLELRKLALGATLALASLAAPNLADAHEMTSPWQFPRLQPYFFFHTNASGNPDFPSWYFAGSNGQTTTQYARAQNSQPNYFAYIRPQAQCWNGAVIGTYGWVAPQAFRNSPSCSSWPNYSTIGAGRVSINM